MRRCAVLLSVIGLFLAAAGGCSTPGRSLEVGSSDHAQHASGPKAAKAESSKVRPVNANVGTPIEIDPPDRSNERSSWSKLLGRFSKPKRIPLPRTDLQSDDLSSDDATTDDHVLGAF